MLFFTKTNFLRRLILVSVLLVIFSTVILPVRADDINLSSEIIASEAKESPKLDGYLNEVAWKKLLDFLQNKLRTN